MNHSELVQRAYDAQKEWAEAKAKFDKKQLACQISEIEFQFLTSQLIEKMNAPTRFFIQELENYDYKQTKLYEDHQNEMMRLERKRLLIMVSIWLVVALFWVALYTF